MIKLAILSLLVLGCVRAAPVASTPASPHEPTYLNRVCVIAATNEPGGSCDDLGRDAGPGRGDVALWHHDGGTKLCWETFDLRAPLACWPLVLSPKEEAERAIAADHAKQDADAKAKAEAVKPAPDATTKATPKPDAKAPKKP